MNSNKWVSIYNDLIEKLKKERPYGQFDKLKIKQYYKNVQNPPYGWEYNRHHIDEIKISGAVIKETPEYNTGECLIVNTIEHYLLHYIIVMAETTKPNHGMLESLRQSGMNLIDAIDKWEKIAKEGCASYNIEFDPEWKYKLTI